MLPTSATATPDDIRTAVARLVDDWEDEAGQLSVDRAGGTAADDADAGPVDSDVVRGFDDAVRRGTAPVELGLLAPRLRRFDLTWDDVLDLRRPPADEQVARARAACLELGLARLAACPRVDLEQQSEQAC